MCLTTQAFETSQLQQVAEVLLHDEIEGSARALEDDGGVAVLINALSRAQLAPHELERQVVVGDELALHHDGGAFARAAKYLGRLHFDLSVELLTIHDPLAFLQLMRKSRIATRVDVAVIDLEFSAVVDNQVLVLVGVHSTLVDLAARHPPNPIGVGVSLRHARHEQDARRLCRESRGTHEHRPQGSRERCHESAPPWRGRSGSTIGGRRHCECCRPTHELGCRKGQAEQRHRVLPMRAIPAARNSRHQAENGVSRAGVANLGSFSGHA
mmetsp:Transcript_108980/g.347950  ORF Transcript_108980/g.347950 Transcript_108980/m.347950 type:complete len:269 (+) Transcript_108980:259-1065(+)